MHTAGQDRCMGTWVMFNSINVMTSTLALSTFRKVSETLSIEPTDASLTRTFSFKPSPPLSLCQRDDNNSTCLFISSFHLFFFINFSLCAPGRTSLSGSLSPCWLLNLICPSSWPGNRVIIIIISGCTVLWCGVIHIYLSFNWTQFNYLCARVTLRQWQTLLPLFWVPNMTCSDRDVYLVTPFFYLKRSTISTFCVTHTQTCHLGISLSSLPLTLYLSTLITYTFVHVRLGCHVKSSGADSVSWGGEFNSICVSVAHSRELKKRRREERKIRQIKSSEQRKILREGQK